MSGDSQVRRYNAPRQRLDDDPRTRLDDIAEDTVEGAGAISEVLFGEDTPTGRKRVFYLSERKLIPVGKLGGKLIASKKKIRRHYDALTSGKL